MMLDDKTQHRITNKTEAGWWRSHGQALFDHSRALERRGVRTQRRRAKASFLQTSSAFVLPDFLLSLLVTL